MIRSLAALGVALTRAALVVSLAIAPALAQVQPSAPVASKGYVDNGLAAGLAATAQEKARAQAAEGLLLPKAGGTMTGPIVLAPGTSGPGDGISVTPNANAPSGTLARQLLNALPSGRKAVEQGDASDLFTRIPSAGSVARALSTQIQQDFGISILNYTNADGGPAKCDNVTDNGVAIRKAIADAAVYSVSGLLSRAGNVLIPQGICAYSGELVVPEVAPITFIGHGTASVLRQTDGVSGGIRFPDIGFTAASKGVSNLAIESGAGYQTSNSFAPGSTGTCIFAQHQSANFALRNVECNNFANGIDFRGVHNTENYNVRVRSYSGSAIRIDGYTRPDGSYEGAGAGNSFIGGIIANDNYTGDGSQAVGIDIVSSGGEFFYGFDIVVACHAVRMAPPSGKQVAYVWFGRILGDTSRCEGWVLDGSAGSVVRIDIINSWASYGDDVGIVTLGANLRGVKLTNWGSRQNKKQGWLNIAGSQIEFVNSDFSENSRANSVHMPAIEIADGVTGTDTFAITGGSTTYQGGDPNAQGSSIKFNGYASGFRITGFNMSGASSGKPMLDVADWSKLSNYVMSDNLPAASGLNPTGAQPFSFAGNVDPGATRYFGPTGPVQTASTAPFWSPGTRLSSSVFVGLTAPPGAGQSFTYRLVVNGTPVGVSGTISGAGSYAVGFNPGVMLARDDTFELQVTSSGGAANAIHRGRIILEP